MYRGGVERAFSAVIIASGLTTAVAGVEIAKSTVELSSSSGTNAEEAHRITSNLNSAEYSLTYHNGWLQPVLIGKMPGAIYHPPVDSDTSKARAEIESAQKMMIVFPSETQESRRILEETEKRLPEGVVGTATYSNEIRDISRARQNFEEKLSPDIKETYLKYEDIFNRRNFAFVVSLMSGIVFLGLSIGVAVTDGLSAIKEDVQDFIETATSSFRKKGF